MGDYLVWFDLLRRKAESRLPVDGSYLGTFNSILRMQNASPPRTDKFLVTAGVHGILSMAAVVRQMRRLFGPIGGNGSKDASAATDVEEKSQAPRTTTIMQRG